ncbi:hypothetical protein B0H17DRAFT_931520 [Mycena rosella]|uniref:Uncharacterized protein n=1 Tax=Mycena rosella TaxID=1033263 RepID=A0AAD7DNU3_MYCRO|nr:hypothetical protein B0H17DRAFT_931520 [Mycena rosella]
MFHKRGLQTDLSNWHGIFLSNFLANCPITWLNLLLTPYVAKHRILPDTQVTTQQDVQTRDLMSYLAGIKCWAARQKKPVYAIKRDQMKGFDYLSPEGMYDAVCAYGLPSQIIDIDHASQTDVKCFIQTAYGTTEPIIITGVNKQGGPMLPLKSTLTTSLGHHYLNDLLSTNPNALIITTSTLKKADPHLPDDHLKLHVAMTEATDDSYIFAKSLQSLRRNTLEMEQFQFAYSWLTQWTKTLDFLRAKVDNPTARLDELKSLIDAFKFPKFLRRSPVTLLRKIMSQCLISRCRALLSLQPIKQTDVEELNRRIMQKIHDELGMPFTPNTKILGLPLKYNGLEFPSLARINAGIVIDGLAHDLNHHIAAYQSMVRITLADWMCTISNCVNPIDGSGLRRDFSMYSGKIPYGWIVAQKVMGSMSPSLLLRKTERCEILKGDVSLSHCSAICDHCNPTPSGNRKPLDSNNLRSLRVKGVRRVNDPSPMAAGRQIWATDESMLPASAGLLQRKSVTASITGPITLVLRIDGSNIVSTQGELMGLTSGIIFADGSKSTPRLYTDYMNVVRMIEDSKSSDIDITHTKGHTDELTLPALMNYEADHYASASQRYIDSVPTAPIPTFFMDDYTFYSKCDGWIESNIRHLIDIMIAQKESEDLALRHPQRMLTSLYEHQPPPDFPYTRAYSAYSATVQLYACSGQLTVADTLYKRKKIEDDGCRFGCNAVEDMHHLFVECGRYEVWREKATEGLIIKTTMKLDEKGVEETARERLLKAAKSLFARDDTVWPLKHVFYYLGHIPPLDRLLSKGAVESSITRERLLHHLAAEWHMTAIRLAGRIFGDYQREMSKKNAPLKLRGKI